MAKRTRTTRPATRTTAEDILAALERRAPLAAAEEWDNVGLLAGRPEWSASRVLLTIDLTDDVANEALRKRTDLVVAYHPPIFKGIRAVTPMAACPTGLLPDLLAARCSIIALHTALDVAEGGTNDVLLNAFELRERYPLDPVVQADSQYKLVVFVPPAEVETLRRALSQAGAGMIGHYDECSYELQGRGTFRGDETTNPTVGRKLTLEYVDEIRLEMVVAQRQLGPVVRTLYAEHSYEEPAFDLYPIHSLTGRARVGLGRVGVLKQATRGLTLVQQLQRIVDLGEARVVGDLKRRFTSVTAAAGAFGVRSFRDPQSLVVTGEFKHHDALELQRRGVTAVHLGHYASERPMLNVLRTYVKQNVPGVQVDVARMDRSPYADVPKL